MTGSTSSMTAHILRRHGITLSKTKAAPENREKNKHTSTGQLRLPKALGLKNKYPRSSTRHGDITRSIGVFIANDMRFYFMLLCPERPKLYNYLPVNKSKIGCFIIYLNYQIQKIFL